ncbi:Tannase/feruloyl esterase [Schizophyllum amplum]|uniref:Carboxylic ester hydrolase n=1 Tax=Schizophyllum amplum TaxID=97359 RepID=A0A550CF76_9AGAR|nr:Tannase/feruloyl esterase [Auriculariopsis ampla]
MASLLSLLTVRVCIALLALTHAVVAQGDFATQCSSFINQVDIENVTVYTTQYVGAGSTVNLSGGDSSCGQSSQVASANLCRITMEVATSPNSRISLEAWFPQNYTDRFLSTGNGGIGGCIQYTDMDYTSSLGFATVGANNGHNGTGGAAFLNHPDVIIDFAWRSLHTGVVIGKQLTELFYGAPHTASYYLGCSTGGRQGWKMAQDFPDDFDGVVAGAPAIAWNSLQYWSGNFYTVTGASGSPTFVSTSQWQTVHQEVLNQCDALDGATDSILENPDLCDFDVTPLICSGGSTANCLTATQAETVRTLLSPLYDENGELIYPRMQPGAEVLASYVMWNGQPFAFSTDWFRYAVLNDSSWNPATLDLADYATVMAQNPGGIETFNGDISAFASAGGKMLHYHGLADGLISSDNSKRYYALVQETMGMEPAELDDFYRFFGISGMGHCSGGDGAANIGNGAGAAGTSPDENVLMSMVRWVEEGVAPEVVRGAKSDMYSGQVSYWRAHCKWPLTNTYVGPGAVEDESAWECT